MEAPIVIATRGSALALAQAHAVLAQCRAAFPRLRFELKIIKTTGDKLQTAAPAQPGQSLPKGLFTKELEIALLKQRADLAVHSLKDLPIELPAGLKLGAVGKRAEVYEVVVYREADYLAWRAAHPAVSGEWSPGQAQCRGFKPQMRLKDFPPGAIFATSSTRRQAQILDLGRAFKVVPLRGNVATRLQKLAVQPQMDGVLLAGAGLARLHFEITPEGRLQGDAVPEGLLATRLSLEEMLPCVGQGAVGIEIREPDGRLEAICERLNHYNTRQCVTAERAFLRAMGGGCQAPVAAYAEVTGAQLHMRAVSYHDPVVKRAEGRCDLREAERLGERLARELASGSPAR